MPEQCDLMTFVVGPPVHAILALRHVMEDRIPQLFVFLPCSASVGRREYMLLAAFDEIHHFSSLL